MKAFDDFSKLLYPGRVAKIIEESSAVPDTAALMMELSDWQTSGEKSPAELFDFRERACDRITELLRVSS